MSWKQTQPYNNNAYSPWQEFFIVLEFDEGIFIFQLVRLVLHKVLGLVPTSKRCLLPQALMKVIYIPWWAASSRIMLYYAMLCYLTNCRIDNICVCVYCNRSQMTSQRVKNKEQRRTTRDEVEWRDCCSLQAVTSSVIYYIHTHKRKNAIYLFYTIKMQIVYWRIFGCMKKEKQVRWRDLTWIWPHLCVYVL